MPITFQIASYNIRIFSETNSNALVYCPLFEEEAEQVWNLLPHPRPTLAVISGMEWNHDLSPWPAPQVFQGNGDFSGGAEIFLKILTQQILPRVESSLTYPPVFRALAGYSMAGLFALWAATRTNCFQRIASMSGSLWFDGFCTYLQNHPFPTKPEFVYLSLGLRERHTKNPRMSQVEDCTRKSAEILQRQDIPIQLEFHPGGHFQDIPQRIARGISFVSSLNAGNF